MKKTRFVFIAVLIMVYLVSATGCWNYREINEVAIVSGLAIDKGNDGKGYFLTAEIVDLKGGGKETQIQSKRVQAEGETIFDAIRNIIKISAKWLYWSHADIVIISRDVAKEGIFPIVDFLHRQREPRLFLHILISKEKTANELLTQERITTDIRTLEMKEMINTEKNNLQKSPHVDLRDFINMLSEEGHSGVLAAVGNVINDGYRTPELSGTAIFKGDKLAGFLDGEDTKFLMFIMDQIKNTMLVLDENTESAYKGTTLEIQRNKTKVKPVYSNGRLYMDIDINAQASVGELGSSNSPIDKKGLEKLKESAEKTLKSNIESVIQKVKTEYGLDIFGFGLTVKREMPSLWKSMTSSWYDIFTNMDMNVNTKIEIKGSGLSTKPVKMGE